MANRLSILGILALFAAVPASASTFFQFAPNPGTPTPLLIVNDTAGFELEPGYTTVSLTNALILWDMPNTLGGGLQAGLLSFSVTTTNFAVGDSINNTLVETGFTGTGSILTPGSLIPILSWTFEVTDSTALTVANNGYTGSFVDSSPLHVVSAQSYLISSDLSSLRFNLSFTSTPASDPQGTIWKSDGLPIIIDPPASEGTCTSCRIAPNYAEFDVPEPATMAMLGFALLGLGFLGRKRFVR
jgi:hypothetical protein